MPPFCRSLDEARRVFDAYACVEPRLRRLWDLCGRAAPPLREAANDAYDVDPFESDATGAYDGWCAEDYFHEHVKPQLLILAGSYRAGADALADRDAYETLYDVLINWALHRTCACCVARAA